AVGVEQVRTLAAGHEPGGAADRPERAHRRVDPARRQGLRPVVQVLGGGRLGGVSAGGRLRQLGHGGPIVSTARTARYGGCAVGGGGGWSAAHRRLPRSGGSAIGWRAWSAQS